MNYKHIFAANGGTETFVYFWRLALHFSCLCTLL